MHEQPASTALDVLPVFSAVLEARDTFIRLLIRIAVLIGRERLVKHKLAQLTRSTERADQARHSRTGKGPWPGSSSIWPVANRDSRKALIRSGAVPLATNCANAAPEAGMALKPP